MTVVTFIDETAAGARADGWNMDVAEEQLTLRELIRRRVWHEVADDRPIDAEEQFARAIKAFSRNGFVVLIGDRQVLAGTEVTFLKLVPLVGG